ncbi:Ricin B lectin domain, partial [Trinorchestia longiramus]
VGGFTWSGHFTWIEVTAEEEKRRNNPVGPTRSPTMAGGLFAIDRSFFWEVGGYDEGMDVWGGENLEMSFRVWMCGGTLETMPCSRVGHIFRSFHPYTFPGNKDTHGLNTARLAEVWMDDYKRLFYMNRPELQSADYGDVSARRALRQKMKCNSFSWYLDNIYPEKFVLDEHSFAYGRVHNLGSPVCLDTLEQENLDGDPYHLGFFDCRASPLKTQLRNNGTVPQICLDTLQADEKKPYDIGLYNCHSFEASSQVRCTPRQGEASPLLQYMSLSHSGELRREDVCAEVSSERRVRMSKCLGNRGPQEWIMTKSGHLLNKESNLCLDSAGQSAMALAKASQCKAVASQQWWFDHYNVSR